MFYRQSGGEGGWKCRNWNLCSLQLQSQFKFRIQYAAGSVVATFSFHSLTIIFLTWRLGPLGFPVKDLVEMQISCCRWLSSRKRSSKREWRERSQKLFLFFWLEPQAENVHQDSYRLLEEKNLKPEGKTKNFWAIIKIDYDKHNVNANMFYRVSNLNLR